MRSGCPDRLRECERPSGAGRGTLVPDDKMPVWSPACINNTFEQDDLYVEMTFIDTLLRRGVDVTARQAGIDFANSTYRLWCANSAARNNLRNGIAAPERAQVLYLPCGDGNWSKKPQAAKSAERGHVADGRGTSGL